jgi:hypothetical protein
VKNDLPSDGDTFLGRHANAAQRAEVPISTGSWSTSWETPSRLPPGSRLRAIAHYDKEVAWSQQSTDEMFSPEIRFTYDDVDLTQTPSMPP